MGDVVNFPPTHSRNARPRGDGSALGATEGHFTSREPLRQAIAPSGRPVLQGDSVVINDTTGRKYAGTVIKACPHERSGATQLYQVICNDGRNRVVTADQIEAVA